MKEFITVGSGWPDLKGKTIFAYIALGGGTMTAYGKVEECTERGFFIDMGVDEEAESGSIYLPEEVLSEEGRFWVPWHSVGALRVDLENEVQA